MKRIPPAHFITTGASGRLVSFWFTRRKVTAAQARDAGFYLASQFQGMTDQTVGECVSLAYGIERIETLGQEPFLPTTEQDFLKLCVFLAQSVLARPELLTQLLEEGRKRR